MLPYVVGVALLIMATLAAYWPVNTYGYISLDDAAYAAENAHVRSGLTRDGVKWAFTSYDAANWHPLTWLSLMLDVQFFGDRPGPHHTVNIALHIASAILLMTFVARATSRPWLAVVVAALFALHPLRVESVAWISERKDVLSGVFWMAAMLAYVSYARKPSRLRYILVAALFAMGLMAKPMLVTFPLVMLLLDYWPLNRFKDKNASVARLMVEKIPLLAMAALSCVVTLLAQRPATSDMQSIGMAERLANAASSCFIYVRQMFWPTDLAILYPLAGLTSAAVIAGTAFIIIASAAAIHWRRSRPYVAVGWLWYLATLVPVLGLVQVGIQAHADRYTYIPMTGLIIAIVFALDELLQRKPALLPAATAAILAIIIALATLTRHQVGYWRNTMMLYMRASAANPPAAQPYLGTIFAPLTQTQMVSQLDEAISLHPGWAQPHAHLAAVLNGAGQPDAAMEECNKAIALKPDMALGHRTMGMLLASRGDYTEAAKEYALALATQPDSTTWNNLASIQIHLGQWDLAETSLKKAIAIGPETAVSHLNLAAVLSQTGRKEEAIAELRKAVSMDPQNAAAHALLQSIEAASR